MEAKLNEVFVSLIGNITDDFYIRKINDKFILCHRPKIKKPATARQLECRKQFGIKYGTNRKKSINI